MFPSSGFFRNAFCPFYQHELCHRPYCHFKHVKQEKKEKEKPKKNESDTKNKNSVHKQRSSKEVDASASRTEAQKTKSNDEDDVMKIVKNIPPSKLVEYAKRKQEEKKLKHLLELIDKENKEKDRTSTSSEGDDQRGLIDAFYNKTKVIGQFTSDCLQINDKPSLDNITPTLNALERKVCECDDPDCTGFIEVDKDENVFCNNEKENSDDDDYSNSHKVKKKKKNKRALSDLDFFGVDSVENDKILKQKAKKKKLNNKSELETRKEKRNIDSSGNQAEFPEDGNVFNIINDDNKVKIRKKSSDAGKSVDIKMRVNEAGIKDYIAEDCVITTGQASLKKRTAHSAEEVSRAPVQARKTKKATLSYVSPGLAAPPPSSSLQSTSTVPNVSADMGYTTETGVYVGKKRVAHAFVPPVVEKVKRPKLPIEIGGKLPHLLRQRFLDKIIDEFMPKCKSEAVACEKGFAEEAVAYQRSSRKQIYLNLCANIIKRIRSIPDFVPTMESSVNPLMTAATTVQVVNRINSSSLQGYKKINTEKKAIKRAIKPPSSTLVNAASVVATSLATKRRLSAEVVELNESNFYQHLQQYLLSDTQLWENKYPREDPDNPELTIIKDYTPQNNLLKRLCCRCGKDYFMNLKGKYVTREECNFHWGKLRKRKERGAWTSYFSCCESDGSGQPCSMCRLHVCDMIGPLHNYVSTDNCDNEDAKRKVFALDCEMCYTTQGLELTRLTVVDFNLGQVIDLFVKPYNPIVDYNTRFSGVTKEHLQDVTTSIDDIHDILLNMFDRETILLGHSLESDFKALKIIHRNVVDTALVFPHRLGLPFKRALRNLMAEHLQKIIQDGEAGHDSCEDARACMELMKYKFIEDNKKVNRPNSSRAIPSSSLKL